MLNEKTDISTKSWLERQEIAQGVKDSHFYLMVKQQGVTAIMLSFEFENGDRFAQPYASLICMEFNPSVGIILQWGNRHVTITGRNLAELYDHLVEHRVKVIREGGEAAASRDDSELFIQAIHREKNWK